MSKYDPLYMDIAIRVAQESKCPRKQVGAVVVTASQALFPGFNGHACGGPNEWEDTGEPNLEVIHAEHNCLNKMLEEGVSAKGATIYTTLSCCLQCAKQLVGAKVKRVVYLEHYRDTSGIDYLRKYGVIVEHFAKEGNNERHLETNNHSCAGDTGCCAHSFPFRLQQERAAISAINRNWKGYQDHVHKGVDGTGTTLSVSV